MKSAANLKPRTEQPEQQAANAGCWMGVENAPVGESPVLLPEPKLYATGSDPHLLLGRVLDHLATLHKHSASMDALLRAARALSVYRLMATYPLAERNARRARLHECLLYNGRPLAQARRAELFAELLTLYGLTCDRTSNGKGGEPAAVWAHRAWEAVTARQQAHRVALRARQAVPRPNGKDTTREAIPARR